MTTKPPLVLLRGGGDLATGVAARLHRSGFHVVVAEIAQPLAVRRLVALAEAVYAGQVQVEELVGRRVNGAEAAERVLRAGEIPVIVDLHAEIRTALAVAALVDARMRKTAPEIGLDAAPFVVGLGPGFVVGEHCHAVVETNRGHHLGRVLWEGSAQADTGKPEPLRGFDAERVLRAPSSGTLTDSKPLGTLVAQGEIIARVNGAPVMAPFRGALRGLLHEGIEVEAGLKIGDLDPRADPSYCSQISDKALAIGGGVLEALLSQASLRAQLGG